MGRDSGYIAIPCAVGGGAEIVMIPEVKVTVDDIIETIRSDQSRAKTSSIIIIAEEQVAGNATAVAAKVKEALPQIDARVTTLGHVQRGGAPTAADRMLASRLGIGCVEGLMEGRKNVMAGIVNAELVYTPMQETITRKKAINPYLIQMVDILSV